MNRLYPLKFVPHYKEKVWGGQRIHTVLGKNFSPLPNCGESWEISGMEGSVSLVSNGFLQGNTIDEVVEVYMGDLVGDRVFDQFGHEFPLLVKFIDTNEPLSVQVHPDSALAMKRHAANGKTEMWYVVHAEPGAEIIVGFKPGVNREIYLKHLENNTLNEILNVEIAMPGDVFFMPAGRVHAIGAGIMLCEIQQASDITYRIYDWDRPGTDGGPRELHNEEAIDAIDFSEVKDYKSRYQFEMNKSIRLAACPYFTTNLLVFDKKIELDYVFLDSFVIYICLEGSFMLHYPGGQEPVAMGDAMLLPAEFKNVSLVPDGASCRLLESYVT